MRIGLDVSAIQHLRWRDYAVRFVFGGIITALTGLIAGRYGPGVAGLFLAFPAIFPAGATLIEKQEREKKRRVGLDGTSRGRVAVGIDRSTQSVSSGPTASQSWSGRSFRGMCLPASRFRADALSSPFPAYFACWAKKNGTW